MNTPPTLPKSRQQLILAVLLLSSLLIWLDNTILNTTFETLADPVRGLGADPAQLQWATGSYTLVFATLMFTAGALGDRFGHRTVLTTGMVVFAASSVWAAYADDAGQLIAARAAMGLGSAFIMPATMAILTWTFTGPARATAIGLFSASAGVGLAAGPLLAGVLLDHFWWGSVFLVNVPVVAVALIGIAALVPNFHSPAPRPLDPAGLLLSITGLAALAYGLIRAGQVASWGRPDVWAPIAAGLILLVAFVVVELRSRQPSFDPRLLAERTFGGGNAALGLLFFAMTAVGFYGAFYLQGARGFSPLEAGLASFPAAVGVMIGGPLGVRLVQKWSLRPVSATALTVAALAMGSFGLFGLHTPLIWIEIAMSVQGIAIGMVIGLVTGTLMSTLPLERAGAGSAVTNTVRQTGSVLGIAVGGTIMSITYGRAIAPTLPGLPAEVQEKARASAELARHAATATKNPDLARAADSAFMHAMHVGTVWTMLIALLAAGVLAITMRPNAIAATPAATEVPEPAPSH
ncbi:MFS transporter [Nocardia jejuensis]|uniref:MFS transporter n=1 Tax=Nocardia jejuensis TaxID=328049 RepID=UPI0008346400|nr:MFS transporter [Nocardia jejuensis]